MEINMITAQALYDLREEYGLCSGSDLHDLFAEILDGEPSPPGRRLISLEAIAARTSHYDSNIAAFCRDVLQQYGLLEHEIQQPAEEA